MPADLLSNLPSLVMGLNTRIHDRKRADQNPETDKPVRKPCTKEYWEREDKQTTYGLLS